MIEKNAASKSDFVKADAYENTTADYEEVPELTEQDFARGTVVLQELAERRRRGRPTRSSGTEQIALRIDKEVLARFRASGPGWQGRMNEALRKAAGL